MDKRHINKYGWLIIIILLLGILIASVSLIWKDQIYALIVDPIIKDDAIYTVTLDPTGGVVRDNFGNELDPYTLQIKYGDMYGPLHIPTKEGYAFAGWYTEQDGGTIVTESVIYKTRGDSTLYAHWGDASSCEHSFVYVYLSEYFHSAKCTLCGYIEHNLPHELNSSSDADYHYCVCTINAQSCENNPLGFLSHACNSCKYKALHEFSGAEQHILDGGGINSSAHKYTCQVCGYIKFSNHTFTYESYDSSDPNYSNYHVKACSDCGYSVPHEHNWSFKKNSMKPYACSTCTLCQQTRGHDIGSYLPVDETTHRAFCKYCNRGVIDGEHVFSSYTIDEPELHYRYECDICGYSYVAYDSSGEDPDNPSPVHTHIWCNNFNAEHDDMSECYNSVTPTQHIWVCHDTSCLTWLKVEDHIWDDTYIVVNGIQYKVCTVCDCRIKVEADSDTCSHPSEYIRWYPSADGSECIWECSNCGATQSYPHNWWDYWLASGEDSHYRCCINCMAEQWASHEFNTSSSGSAANCLTSKTTTYTCEVCHDGSKDGPSYTKTETVTGSHKWRLTNYISTATSKGEFVSEGVPIGKEVLTCCSEYKCIVCGQTNNDRYDIPSHNCNQCCGSNNDGTHNMFCTNEWYGPITDGNFASADTVGAYCIYSCATNSSNSWQKVGINSNAYRISVPCDRNDKGGFLWLKDKCSVCEYVWP